MKRLLAESMERERILNEKIGAQGVVIASMEREINRLLNKLRNFEVGSCLK
jgi:hypothetical protein